MKKTTPVTLAALLPVMLAVTVCSAFVDDIRITPVVTAVEKSKTAVVNISTREQVYDRSNPFSRSGRDPFFDRFFQNFFDNNYRQAPVKAHLGSGVIFDARGYVLTNWHVIEKASSITVTTADEQEYGATLVGADPKSDLAVLKIESEKVFSQIPLGNSDSILIGETVIAIGNPFGLSHTVTTGVVSAKNRSIKAQDQVYENFIQTDASINPGNSGGPLLNINGELIGINTAIYGDAQGIGFAIPINTAKRIVDDLLQFGEVRPPWLGLTVQDLSDSVASHLGYSGTGGVIVSELYPGGPAEENGIQSADIVIAVDGRKTKSKASFDRALRLYTAYDTINMTIFRKGNVLEIPVKAAEFPPEYIDDLLWNDFGMKLIDNSAAIARTYGLYETAGAVIQRIRPSGQAYAMGLRPGDIILKVQGSGVRNLADLRKKIVNNIHRDVIIFLIQRGRYGYYVTFEF